MKKFISIIIIILTIVSNTPTLPAFAQEEATPSSELVTEVNQLNQIPLQDPSVSSLSNTQEHSSAYLSQPAKLRQSFKKSLKADESATVVIDNAIASDLTLSVFDFNGNQVNASTEVISDSNPVIIKIHPAMQFKPGRYRVKISGPSNNTMTQDFTWGVLAINTTKSIYTSGETASIHMAVLDDTGEMVCNSDMTLNITSPSLQKTTLTTESGQIIVNPQCYSKDLTIVPDYQAEYSVSETGLYSMELTATNPDGSYTINDSFEARERVAFDIQRSSATRIYPPNTYPVTFDITANQDFEGTIKEYVPASFQISKINESDTKTFDSIETETANADKNVLGAEMFNIGKPFRGDYQLSLGFGRQHRDPTLESKYTEFGVLGHDGADFALPMDTPVIAVADGEIVRAGPGDYGTTIVIQHAWGKSYYGHLDKVIETTGKKVTKGQLIGLSGNTGLSSGPHLHFGIKPNKNDGDNGYYGKINPLAFMGLTDTGVEHGQVAGVAAPTQQDLKDGVQVINWNVSVKKGEKIKLGYQFNAPLISPELYLLGPLKFIKNGVPIFSETRHWQIAADAVVVEGGIVTSEAQFGGLQRKVAYVNSNWYAFYNDGGNISYKKSSDGVTWGSAQPVDSADTDNISPSIDVSSNTILIAWVDTGTEDRIEIKGLDTSSDTLTGLCAGPDEGSIDTSSFMVSIAALSTTSGVVAISDTSSDTEVNIYEVTSITGGTCTPTYTDVHPGNIAFGSQGSGLTASDRPVLVGLDSTTAMMVFTDGSNLKSAYYDASRDEWRRNNQTIAAITDSTYSVATDGTNVWVLTQNGTTASRLYHYPVSSTGVVEAATIDSHAGSTAADAQDSELDMWCPPSDAADCKIVYVDDLETASPDVIFIDCDNENCSSSTSTVIGTNVGSATVSPGPQMFCVAVNNCKVVFGTGLGANNPDVVMVDCGNAQCNSGNTTGTITTDFGGTSSVPSPAIYCLSDTDCQVTYFDDDDNDIFLADCSNASCSTRNSLTAVILDINTTASATVKSSIWCPSSGDCQIVYHDGVQGDLTIRDCSNISCSTANATTDIDANVGGTTTVVPNAIDCTSGATDCKILYSDAADTAVYFVDCSAAGCASFSTTTLDDTAGNITKQGVDLDCSNGASDCKGIFVGDTTSPEDQYFFDCDNADCSSGSAFDLDNPPTRAAVSCPSSANCKLVYYDALVGGTDVPVVFADCTNENCIPDWESLTAPWPSGETNVTSVSLTYNSSNNSLIANIIKDASEQAYYKISDASTISWGSETAYEFTAGDLDNISSPETAAGTSVMGVLLRQGSNVEFDLLAATSTGPTNDQLLHHGGWFSGGVEQPFTF